MPEPGSVRGEVWGSSRQARSEGIELRVQGTRRVHVAGFRAALREARGPVVLLVLLLSAGGEPGAGDERSRARGEGHAGPQPTQEEGSRRCGSCARGPRVFRRKPRRVVRVRTARGVPAGRSWTVLQEARSPRGTAEALENRVHGRRQGPPREGGRGVCPTGQIGRA